MNRKWKIASLLMAAVVMVSTMGTVTADAASKASAVKKARPKVTLTAGEGQVTVKWKKIKKAKGYQVYRSMKKKGTYKRIATIEKGSRVKYINKKLKKGKRYYFKVRAYTKTGGKKVYSKYSKVKSVTTLTKLQAQTKNFLSKATRSSMSKEQKLRASYSYMRDHYKYIPRAMVSQNNKNWVDSYASRFFADKGGNCYSWAAAYTTVAKNLGYSARAAAGTLYYADGTEWGEHSWTEIRMGGQTYIFDPEIEYAQKRQGKQVSLYKITENNGLFIYEER